MAVGRVIGERVEISGSLTLVTQSTALERAGLNLVDVLTQLRAGFDQFFAALGVDDRAAVV